MPSRTKTWLVALALMIVAVAVGGEVYQRLIVPAPPLNFDEAAHSLQGYYILRDVLRLDLRELWVNTHIQTLWPPGFSYLQAPFLLLFGVNDAGARLFAYVMLVLTALMACAVAYEIAPDLAPVTSIVSGLIAFTAPGWLFVGSWANQETPVAFVAFVVFWLYLRARRSRRAGAYLLTGIGLFFFFLTKYNYAAFAVAAIGAVDMADRGIRVFRRRSPVGPELRGWLALFGPLALGILFWFYGGQDVVSTDIKWRDFSFFVSNEDSGYSFWSEQNLLFYVRATANWLMPGGILATAAIAGAGYAVARVRRAGVALLALFFCIGFLLATIHPLKSERYITPIFPSLWLLTGLGAATVWRALGASGSARGIKLAVAAAPIMIAGWSWVTFIPALSPVWAGETAAGLRLAADKVVAWQAPGKPLLIIGTFGELGPPYFEWRFRPVRAFAESGAPIQYDAPPGQGTNIERVRNWARENPGAQITTITIATEAALFNTGDMRNKSLWKQELAEAFAVEPGYQLVDTLAHPGSGLTVRYYASTRLP